jgi:hypothetical protein
VEILQKKFGSCQTAPIFFISKKTCVFFKTIYKNKGFKNGGGFMRFIANKRFILAKVEEKDMVNVYTFLDLHTFDKFTSIGRKFKDLDLVEKEIYEVEVSIKLYPEQFETKAGERKYLNVANTFVMGIKKVDDLR